MLAATCKKLCKGETGFEVMVTSGDCPPFTPRTCVNEVEIKIDGYTVTFPRVGPYTIAPPLPVVYTKFSVTQTATTKTLTTENDVTVRYQGDYNVYVKIPCIFFDKMCGICGDANGDASNDCLTSHGVDQGGSVSTCYNPTTIGQSYQYDQGDLCDRHEVVSVPATIETQDQPLDLPAGFEDAKKTRFCAKFKDDRTFIACADRMDRHAWQEMCAYDVAAATGLTGDNRANAACPVMRGFADRFFAKCPKLLAGLVREMNTHCNACNPNPCRNGGSCTNILGGGYKCRCLSTNYGLNCQHTYRVTAEHTQPIGFETLPMRG